MNDDVLEAVNKIIGVLQDNKWSAHPESLLLSSQGKLAVYQATVASMVADANKTYTTNEISVKQQESELFIKFREEGMTIDEAKAHARVEMAFNCKAMLESKFEYERLRGVLNAIEAIITACQVQLRSMNREASTAQYQNR